MATLSLEDNAVSLTRDLLRIPSVTPDSTVALDFVEQRLHSANFRCWRLMFEEHGEAPVDNLFARFGEGSPHLSFAGHVDVVPVGDEAAWTQPPFGAKTAGGFLYGRGATDMKSGVAAAVAAATDAVCAGFPGSISFIITGDEEGPAVNGTVKMVDWMRQHGHIPDHCIVGEPTARGTVGDTVKVGRRGSLSGTVTVIGAQGHAAYPHLAENPVPRLVRLVDALLGHPLDMGTDQFEPSNLEVVDLSTGNTAWNVIPEKAWARFNIRFNPLQTPETLERLLREWLDAAAKPDGISYTLTFEPFNSPAFLTEDNHLTDVLCHACRETAGIEPALTTGGGTSDARFIKSLCPVVELGLPGRTMHAVNERVALKDVAQLAALYRAIITRYFGLG